MQTLFNRQNHHHYAVRFPFVLLSLYVSIYLSTDRQIERERDRERLSETETQNYRQTDISNFKINFVSRVASHSLETEHYQRKQDNKMLLRFMQKPTYCDEYLKFKTFIVDLYFEKYNHALKTLSFSSLDIFIYIMLYPIQLLLLLLLLYNPHPVYITPTYLRHNITLLILIVTLAHHTRLQIRFSLIPHNLQR